MTLSRPLHYLFCFVLLLADQPAWAEASSSIVVDDDIEIDILNIGESADTAIIWFACNQGDETAEFETARAMAPLGYRFYFPDMLSAHFLSPTPSNIARVPVEEIEKVITGLLDTTEASQVYLIGGARAAVPVLKALASDIIRRRQHKLKGALLITPRINRKKPEPGAEPVYIEAVGHSIHPIRVLEGERTPNRWGLPFLQQSLAQSGSPVSTELIKGVRGFFYLRSDKNPDEEKMTAQLPRLIHENLLKIGDHP